MGCNRNHCGCGNRNECGNGCFLYGCGQWNGSMNCSSCSRRNSCSAYQAGFRAGFDTGRSSGYNQGYQAGSTSGYKQGYNAGYHVGYQEGCRNCSEAAGVITTGNNMTDCITDINGCGSLCGRESMCQRHSDC